jgi:hypothetical protein
MAAHGGWLKGKGEKMRWIALVVLVSALTAATCAADEVSDAIAQAQSAYSSANYKEASTQLQTALVGVNQKMIDLLIQKMPAPPAGWQADEPDGMDSAAFGLGFFAGLVVSRTYTTPSGSSIEFTIAANSPMLATLRMFVSNPMLAGAQSGMKKVSMCGYDAIEETEDEAAIQILAGNATLISVDGQSPQDMNDVRTLASSTDCKGIVAIVE